MQTKSFAMAVSCKRHVLLVIILALWRALPVASAARPFNCIVPLPTPSHHEPAPALNFALPRHSEAVEVVMIPVDRVTKFSKTVYAEEEMRLKSNSGSTASGHSRRRGRSRTFGSMYLNFLPKGSMPSSGPSRGTDSHHN